MRQDCDIYLGTLTMLNQTSHGNMNTTSTVDWCEENYAVLSFVAEFWNTISSFALFYAGVKGYRDLSRYKGSSIFFVLALVGLGSVAFHGILTVETQMLDEIPMVFILAQFLCNYLDRRREYLHKYIYIVSSLYSYGIYRTALYPEKRIQFVIFQLTVVGIAFYLFIQFLRMKRQIYQESLLWKASSFFLLAWGCWLFDYFGCSTIKTWMINPQLHAFWHVFSAVGVYHFCLLSVTIRNKDLSFGLEKNNGIWWGLMEKDWKIEFFVTTCPDPSFLAIPLLPDCHEGK